MMTTRKIVLLSTSAALACLWILQLIFSGNSAIPVYTLAEVPDGLTINRPDNSIVRLYKEGERWLVGEPKYPADTALVTAMLQALGTVKVLGTVSGSADYARYGIPETGRLTVTALRAGKVIRTLVVGKNASTNQQSYIVMDDKKDVWLASGNLKDTFDRTLADLRDKTLWQVPPEGITKLTWNELPTAKGNAGATLWEISASGTPILWTLNPAKSGAALDQKKVLAWINQVASLRAQAFAPDNLAVAAKGIAQLVISAAGKAHTLTILAKENDQRYLCTSPENPSPFYLDAYTVQNLFKAPKDLES